MHALYHMPKSKNIYNRTNDVQMCTNLWI